MDRKTIYAGQVPLETDVLTAQQFAMTALAQLSQTVFGTAVLVDSFTVTPTTPATLNVLLTPGTIYQMENLEATSWSSLPADTAHTVMKQGILLDPATIGITPPTTFGYSQVFLIEVQYQDLDTGSTVLPYYNAANPSSPFSGPGNAGTAQNTIRQGKVAYQVKAGTAAPTGSQVAPSVDAGWTGLYNITVANGATSVTSGNIVKLVNAPYLATNGYLPQIPTGVQDNTWTFANDTSAGGAAIATSAQTLNTSAILTFASVPAWVAVGMKAYDLTTTGAITGGQTVSSVTSTTVTLSGNVNATVNSGDQIAFSNNAMVVTIAPAPASLVPGLSVRVKASGTNTGPTTLAVNTLGAVAIHRANGSSLSPGDIAASMIVDCIFDGSAFQIVNFEGVTGSTTTNNNTFTLNIPYAVDSGTVNAVVANFSPAITSLSAGLTVEVKITNTNTGASTLQCNALGAVPIVDRNGLPLIPGMLAANQITMLIYNGTSFQQLIGASTYSSIVNFYVDPTIGNDNNDGLSDTSGHAFATIQGAVNAIMARYPSLGRAILNLAATTHTGGVNFASSAISQWEIKGNDSTPSNCIISNPSSTANFNGCGVRVDGCYVIVHGVKITSHSFPCAAIRGAEVFGYNNNFIAASDGSPDYYSITGSFLRAFGTMAHTGNCTGLFQADADGLLMIGSPPLDISSTNLAVTLNGTPVWSTGAAYATSCGSILLSISATFSGAASGPRYFANINGNIVTNGSGGSFFPGSTSGTTSTGGIYN